MAQCDAVTQRGKGPRCVNGDAVAVVVDGATAWRCHLHNPLGLYRLQVAARLAERRAARAARAGRAHRSGPAGRSSGADPADLPTKKPAP